MVYVPPTIAVYLSAHNSIDLSQDNIAMRPDAFRDWYKALAGRQSLLSWMAALGINDEFAIAVDEFVASTSVGEDGLQVCVIFALHLLSNNHLPPLEQQKGVKKEFSNDGLRSLYSQLKDTRTHVNTAIVENIDHLGRQEGAVNV
jgi:hypothetical protein